MADIEQKEKAKNKYAVLGITALLVVLAFAVGGYFYLRLSEDVSKVEVVDPTKVKTRKEGVIVVGVNTKSPPLKFFDASSELVGLDIDFLKAAFEIMGKEYELRPMRWADKDELLNSKEIDLIWGGVSITEKRKKIYLMSKPYIGTSILAVTAANSDIHSLQDLAHKKVGHQRGSFTKGLLEEFSKTNPTGTLDSLLPYRSSSAAMTAILEGKIDASVSSRASVLYYSSNSPGKFRVLSEPFHKLEGLSVAGRLGDTELIAEVNNAIDKLNASGEMQKIEKRWFGE